MSQANIKSVGIHLVEVRARFRAIAAELSKKDGDSAKAIDFARQGIERVENATRALNELKVAIKETAA